MADVDRAAGVRRIIEGSVKRGLDPWAVIAVSRTEGLSGGIGDGGHAFGPFQLNNAGGAYPSGAPQEAEAANAWAWSAEGIDYALDRIAGVAQGLQGQQAISSIILRFERPAAPGPNITAATGYYRDSKSYAQSVIGAGSLADDLTVGDVLKKISVGGSPIDQAVDVSRAIGDLDPAAFLGRLTDPNYILRGLQIAAGAAMVAGGLFLLAKQIALGEVAKAVPLPGAAKRELEDARRTGERQAEIGRARQAGRQGSSSRRDDGAARSEAAAAEQARRRQIRAEADRISGDVPY